MDSAVVSSSVIPSLNTSPSASPLMFAKGSTAMDGPAEAPAPGPVRRPPPRAAAGSSAAASSAAEAKRSSAREASARASAASISAGTSSRCARRGGTGSTSFCAVIAIVESPVKGGVPASISYIMHPSEYRSLRASTGSPIACSGLM